ncbi:MAG: hypothetical protein ACYCUG_09070 [Acidimicrobiales bacterium]
MITALAVVHVAVVGLRYHVGSFDDDAAYMYMARGLLHGVGLTGSLPNGYRMLLDYPPGYPAVLVPVLWLFGTGHGFVAERMVSVACTAAVFPMTWVWLRRRGMGERPVAAVLILLALNPVVATFGSMATPDMPFVVVFLGLVLAAGSWGASTRRSAPWAVVTVVLAAGGVWLKEAGLAMAAGVVLWLAWSRRWTRAAGAAAGTAALLAPLLAARLAAHIPVAGSRYTGEIDHNVGGGLLHQITVLPAGAAQFVFYALYAGVTPVDSPLSDHLPALVVFAGVASAAAAVLCTVGAVAWWRRHGSRDVVVWVVGAYALECVVYPYVNERRALLVVPVLTAWYVLGAAVSGRWLVGVARRRGWADAAAWHRRFAAAACVGAALLLVQFPTDYKEAVGQATSQPGGAPYMTLLARLGPRSARVETDYLWTTALFTGHPGVKDAFYATYAHCSPAAAFASIREDRAAYGLVAAFNGHSLDDACLARLAGREPWSVVLLHTARDDATVVEYVGPGTVHPRLRALLSVERVKAGRVWHLPPRSLITQVSVGATAGVTIRLRAAGGWWTVANRGRPAPWTLVQLAHPVVATAVSVTGGAAVQLVVLGSTTAP